jgi:hypothetical protein
MLLNILKREVLVIQTNEIRKKKKKKKKKKKNFKLMWQGFLN